MTELEELKHLLAQPLPGGRGFQEARAKRIEYLHGEVMKTIIQLMVDVNSASDLAEQLIETWCGKQVEDPRIVTTDEFNELWTDYHPADDGEEITGE